MTRYIKPPKPLTNDFTVIYDKQEKKPWLFLRRYFPLKREHLKVGDYTIEGLEDLITIEKKSGLVELLTDLSASYRPTFKRFLSKMATHPIRCIVVAEELNSDTVRRALTTLRKKSNGRSQCTEETLWYWIAEITTRYGVPLLFVGEDCISDVVTHLFQLAYRRAKEIK